LILSKEDQHFIIHVLKKVIRMVNMILPRYN
jgi:hypothetical protein